MFHLYLALSFTFSLSPYGSQNVDGEYSVGLESISPPLVPLFTVASSNYDDCVQITIERANQVFSEFLASDDGIGFEGDVRRKSSLWKLDKLFRFVCY